MWVRSLSQEDPLEKGMATHSKYSCLENPMDKGAWRAIVHRVAESWRQLKYLAQHSTFVCVCVCVCVCIHTHIYLHITESSCCIPETNTTCKSIIFQ